MEVLSASGAISLAGTAMVGEHLLSSCIWELSAKLPLCKVEERCCAAGFGGEGIASVLPDLP